MLGAVGPELGGVYVTDNGVANDSVPHVGEQVVPFAASPQVTPLFVESFCTFAENTIAVVPAWTEVNLVVIETEMLFPLFPFPAPGLQPAINTTTETSETQLALFTVLGTGVKGCFDFITLLQVRG